MIKNTHIIFFGFHITKNGYCHVFDSMMDIVIVPMLQILEEMLITNNYISNINMVKLLFANKSKYDILCQKELHLIKSKLNDKFTWLNIIENEETNIETNKKNSEKQNMPKIDYLGRINQNILKQELSNINKNDTLILICGKKEMLQEISGDTMRDSNTNKKIQGPLQGYLKELGYQTHHVFKF